MSARSRILADVAFPLAVAPLGLVCYMVYLYHLLGDGDHHLVTLADAVADHDAIDPLAVG